MKSTTKQFLTSLLKAIEPEAKSIAFYLEGGYQWDEETQQSFWNPFHDQVYGTPLHPICKDHKFTFYLIFQEMHNFRKSMDLVSSSPHHVLGCEELNLEDPKYWDSLLTYSNNMVIYAPSQELWTS